MNLIYPIVLVQEDSKWWAYIPDMPGIYGSGDSEDEAKKNIVQALELYIEDVVEEGTPIPMSHIKKIGTDQIHIAIPA